jgi:hypothetical protein
MTDRMLRVTPPALQDAEILRLKARLVNTIAPALQKVPSKDLTRKKFQPGLFHFNGSLPASG